MRARLLKVQVCVGPQLYFCQEKEEVLLDWNEIAEKFGCHLLHQVVWCDLHIHTKYTYVKFNFIVQACSTL